MIDYNKRLVEVDEVLKYLSEEDISKIPEDIRQLIKDNKDKEYVWKYDDTKPLKDQNLNRDTIAFLSYLNMEYLLNEDQKQLMQEIHENNEKKLEGAKAEKYSIDDLFSNKSSIPEEVEQKINIQEQSLVECKESFLKKLFNKIKNLFKR